jgi:hypothetical protein
MSEPERTPTDSDEASTRLARALRMLVGQPRTRPPARDLTEAFAYLERDVEEVRTRVNALFFAVLVSALGQLVTKVLS